MFRPEWSLLNARTIAPVCTTAEEHPIIACGPQRTIPWPWAIISSAGSHEYDGNERFHFAFCGGSGTLLFCAFETVIVI